MENTGLISIAIRSFARSDYRPIELLREKGYKLLINQTGQRLEAEQLSKFISEADGIIAGTEKYTGEVLAKAPRLKVISRVGTGIDNIDANYINQRRIKVLNTPEAPSWAVAEHTIALMFSLLKKLVVYDKRVRERNWETLEGYMLRERAIGIIGLGRVGRKVANMCTALGCKVLGFDPYIDHDAIKNEVTIDMMPHLVELVRRSDIITLHVSGLEDNHNLISMEEIGQMKQGAFIINTSRGTVIDEIALLNGLKKGEIAGAALDVFAREPYIGPLLDMENVILTPHVASNVKEARIKMEIEAVNNLISGLENC
jgi:D-3-phosphoglycerate dehydrogenase / 2-oxoglutarate reductase